MEVSELRDEIKLLLGNDVVRIELSDNTIDRLIYMAFRVLKPYISETKLITKAASRCMDFSEDNVLEVLRVFPASVMYRDSYDVEFDFQFYQMNKIGKRVDAEAIIDRYNPDSVYIKFEFQDGKLMINEGSVLGYITAECIVDIDDIKDLRDERAIAWLQRYAIALVKESLGRIRAKFRSSNLPVEFDGDTLLSEAQSEKGQLEQELVDRSFGPSFVLR